MGFSDANSSGKLIISFGPYLYYYDIIQPFHILSVRLVKAVHRQVTALFIEPFNLLGALQPNEGLIQKVIQDILRNLHRSLFDHKSITAVTRGKGLPNPGR